MTVSPRRVSTAFLVGAWFLSAAGTVRAESWKFTIKGDAAITAPTVVVAEVQGVPAPGFWKSDTEIPNGKLSRSGEVFKDGGKTFLVLLVNELGGGEFTSTTMTKRETPNSPIFYLDLKGPDVGVNLQPGFFTTYHAQDGPKPYYYPLIGPDRKPVTRAYPMKQVEGEDRDHPHQRSMWFSHGDVNGFDFWASDPLNKPNPKFGAIQETSRAIVHNGLHVGVMRTTDDWLGLDGKKVCEDERTVLFTGTDGNALRLIDFDVTIKATAGPVTFGDTKEGMFGLRVASSMDVKRKLGGKITNAEGATDNDAWGKASPWVDYTGPVEGKTVGIAILNHPDSFRYPTTWHVRDYGLFAANPFGWHDFGLKKSGAYTVPAGESIRFRYRVLLHSGDTDSANVPNAFNGFAKPPAVTAEKE